MALWLFSKNNLKSFKSVQNIAKKKRSNCTFVLSNFIKCLRHLSRMNTFGIKGRFSLFYPKYLFSTAQQCALGVWKYLKRLKQSCTPKDHLQYCVTRSLLSWFTLLSLSKVPDNLWSTNPIGAIPQIMSEKQPTKTNKAPKQDSIVSCWPFSVSTCVLFFFSFFSHFLNSQFKLSFVSKINLYPQKLTLTSLNPEQKGSLLLDQA